MKSRYLNPTEVDKLRAGMGAEAWLPMQVALETGLRVGDVVKLAPRDIGADGRLDYTAQKTGKRGIAHLSAATVAALRRLSGREWVFESPRDPSRHLTRQAIWKRVKTTARRVGLPPKGVSPHAARKVFAVQEYERGGIDAARVALQHSDMATTELYAMSDWTTGDHATDPLLRGDLPRILRAVAEWLNLPEK